MALLAVSYLVLISAKLLSFRGSNMSNFFKSCALTTLLFFPLTASWAEISEEQAAVTRFLQIIETIRRGHMFYHDDYGASIPLEPLYTHILATMNLVTQAEAFAAPGAIGARWVNPPTPFRLPTEQERNARMWLPRFAPPTTPQPRAQAAAPMTPPPVPPPFTGEGHLLDE